MKIVDRAKKLFDGFTTTLQDTTRAHREKGEFDVASDPEVAGSRLGAEGEDGEYVGRTTPDDAIDAGQSGAEARSEQKRLSQ
ncbi:MAG: hypothetical protein QOH57_3086 [Mycobacterium sp.]|jgi:hypothetical protein|nr:hypothetical protein [Mycobacterium sp.]